MHVAKYVNKQNITEAGIQTKYFDHKPDGIIMDPSKPEERFWDLSKSNLFIFWPMYSVAKLTCGGIESYFQNNYY